ncbi:type IV pilin protein [Francisella sp. SYW-9]|uniref:type IV pilin protein n=1 Tax=Francisella sp. SYW-9 TaxID=2610888 RepID=UPI00123C7ED7|nr:prepilin-type N-terminal cleavage/methylation domain-containing protein [Francisella sp. SYW-9]
MINKLNKNKSNLLVSGVKEVNSTKHMSCKKENKGITLVELIITISLIAILASVSIPIYSDYKTRAKIGGEITKIGDVKMQINEVIALSDLDEGDQIRNIYI